MTNYKEEWRKIQGYEGLYEVSNLGRVRSIDRIAHRVDGIDMFRAGKMLTTRKKDNGYIYIDLWKNNKAKLAYVHRLVATAFIDNPNELPVIDHLNCDRADNRPENLEWVTITENSRRAANARVKNNKKDSKVIVKPKIQKKTTRKVIAAINLKTGAITRYNSMMAAERALKLANGAVSQGIKHNWHYGGYKFELI